LRGSQKALPIRIAVIFLSFAVITFYEISIFTPNRIEYGNVSVEQAKKLIESNPFLVIVDVRTDPEFQSDHIEGAINLCVCYEEELLKGLNPNDRILVYCLSGTTRSAKAMMILNENGYAKVYNMLGGITEWIELGYPVVNG